MKKLLASVFAISFSLGAHADPRLYVFDCGHLSFPDVSAFGLSNEETTVRELFVPCYLIEHEGERMIWDAGLPLNMVGPRQPDASSWYETSIIDQLAQMDISPEDIDYTAYSHFHYDHVGAANAFANATLLIQQTEFEAAFETPETNPVFRPELYDQLRDSDKIMLDGDFDVFGDGSVMIISAPGHTPGHQVLKLELENFGPLVLSGDLYHFEASRRLRRTPVFNTDAGANAGVHGQGGSPGRRDRRDILDRTQFGACGIVGTGTGVLRLARPEQRIISSKRPYRAKRSRPHHCHSARSEADPTTVIPRGAKPPLSFCAERSGVAESPRDFSQLVLDIHGNLERNTEPAAWKPSI